MAYRPNYITSVDHPWLDRLLQTYITCAGLSFSVLEQRIHSLNIPENLSAKLRRSRRYLDRISIAPKNVKLSRDLRMQYFSNIFSHAAKPTSALNAEILATVRDRNNLDEEQDIWGAMLSDIANENIVLKNIQISNLCELANEINLNFIKSQLRYASAVTIRICGNARKVVQLAKLKGLICTITRQDQAVILTISGPLSIVRKTKIYGSALGDLLTQIVWCDDYRLVASCDRKNSSYELVLKSGDPVIPGRRPVRYDSKLEERFVRSFARHGADWILVREPHPVEAHGTLIFPDFLIKHRYQDELQFYCEIVGFWDHEYLNKKLTAWRSKKQLPYVLCVSESLRANDDQFAAEAGVYFFKSRINIEKVLTIGKVACTEFQNPK